MEKLYLNRRQPRSLEFSRRTRVFISKKRQYQDIASIRVPGRWPSEKVTTQVRIGIGYSQEKGQRIIRCCRQVLHQESELLDERFGAKVSGPADIPSSAFFKRDNEFYRVREGDLFGDLRLRLAEPF